MSVCSSLMCISTFWHLHRAQNWVLNFANQAGTSADVLSKINLLGNPKRWIHHWMWTFDELFSISPFLNSDPVARIVQLTLSLKYNFLTLLLTISTYSNISILVTPYQLMAHVLAAYHHTTRREASYLACILLYKQSDLSSLESFIVASPPLPHHATRSIMTSKLEHIRK